MATLKLDDVCESIQSIEDFNSHNLNIAVIDLVQRLKCFQPQIQDKILLLHVSFVSFFILFFNADLESL